MVNLKCVNMTNTRQFTYAVQAHGGLRLGQMNVRSTPQQPSTSSCVANFSAAIFSPTPTHLFVVFTAASH